MGVLAAGLVAGTPTAESEEPAEPIVGLDQLLRLPESLELGASERGGATAREWRTRFQAALAGLSAARAALHSAQTELADMAEESDNWQMAAPGVKEPTQSPVSFKLRQQIRRHKEEIEGAQRRLEGLRVEADLADVPEEWRQ